MTEPPRPPHPWAMLSLTAPSTSVTLDEMETHVTPVPTARMLYEQHAAFVWRALRALGVREADLDDLVHEVFIVVHRKLPTFEGRAKMTTWLFGIAGRVASDHRRSARVRREDIVEHPSESTADTALGADAEVARHQARAALQLILDGMPAEQRVVFVLFEVDGLRAEEIATLVGSPLNTVYSRLRLARQHFEQELARLRKKGWP